MQASHPLSLSPQALEKTRAAFIAFYAPMGWGALQDPDVDLFSLGDLALSNLWRGWVDRSLVARIQSIEGPSDVNDWFLSLEKGHQEALLGDNDRWALANAAYRFALQKQMTPSDELLRAAASIAGSEPITAPDQPCEDEALRLRISHLERSLGLIAHDLRLRKTNDHDHIADVLVGVLSETQAHAPKLFLPPKMECDDGYPSDDMTEVKIWNRCIDTVGSMNSHLSSNFIATSSPPESGCPEFRYKAQLLSWRLGQMSSASDPERKRPLFEKPKTLLWNELVPGDYWAFTMIEDRVSRDHRPEFAYVFGNPDCLYVHNDDGVAPLDESFSSYQFVRGPRPKRTGIDFKAAAPETGVVIITEGAL